MDYEKRGRGRPRKEKSYDIRCEIRISEDELDKLNHLNIDFDENKSEVFRKALNLYYRTRMNSR